MSRLDKAIEIATRKRNQTNDIHQSPVTEEPVELNDVVSSPQRSRPSITSNFNNPFLVTINDQNSPAAEQYRKLKSLIVKLTEMGELDKALMVTSSVAGEGKTLTSLNLAITMAQDYDHTVLLVEADIRKPSILKYLELESQTGLTDCVLDDLDVGEVLVKTGIGSLTVLPAGRTVDNPVELFSSKKMTSLFHEIKQRYNDRYVIVDTTPLLPFAEPHYIANLIGAVLMVTREGLTTTDKLKKSLEILKNNNLLGVVANGVSRTTSLQGYYGYYGYQ